MEALLMPQQVTLSDRDFRQISDLVYKHCGINLHEDKKELVRARLAKILRKKKFGSFKDYMKHVMIDKSGNEFSHLIDSLSTNLTSFFREMQHFEFLKNKFLPPLLERKRQQRNHRIRIWSAGCSSGEEPYSLAITMRDELAGLGRWDVKILATDISTRVLDTAKRGIYEEKKVQPVTLMQKQKYLIPHNIDGQKTYEVNNLVRSLVIFKYLNLMEQWPIKAPLDTIFCRNVMIYFDKPTQSRLVNRYWNLLDKGGILLTGHSESLTGIEHKFKYVQPTIYMKT